MEAETKTKQQAISRPNRASSDEILGPVRTKDRKWKLTLPKKNPRKKNRPRKFFTTKKEAIEWKAGEKERVAKLGQGLAALANDQIAMQDFHWCTTQSEKCGKTVREIVEGWLESQKISDDGKTIEEWIEELLLLKKAVGANPKYIAGLKTRLTMFANFHKGKALNQITRNDANFFLHETLKGMAPKTINGYRAFLRVLFSHGLMDGEINPFSKSAKATTVREFAETFTIEQTKILLENAPKELLPFYAVGVFCGIRVSEIYNLTWSKFDWQKQRILVEGANAKTSIPRHVPIPPALVAWLYSYKDQAGPICPKPTETGEIKQEPHVYRKFRVWLEKTFELRWPKNAVRDGFASYGVAKFQEVGQIAYWAGHDEKVLQEFYFSLKDQEEGEEYFSILPERLSEKGREYFLWCIENNQKVAVEDGKDKGFKINIKRINLPTGPTLE